MSINPVEEKNETYRLYPYRWVVLIVFMLMVFAVQPLWISYSPIIQTASDFYGVDFGKIGLFSMVFMIVFLPFSLPASWVIDTWGFKKAVSIGAILLGTFGVLRGILSANFWPALLCTIGIALAQVLILNSWAKLAMLWFGLNERASVLGMILMANTVGTIAGSMVTPYLVEARGLSIPTVQMIYGVFAAVTAVLFLVFGRDKPETPPAPEALQKRVSFSEGLKIALRNGPFLLFLFTIFAGMGIFNGVTTWVGAIVAPRGFNGQQAGFLISLMLLGGVAGSQIVPRLSDKTGKRQPFLLVCYLGAVLGLIGITFAQSQTLMYVSSVVLGFFLIGSNPVGTQFGVETAAPTPEGTTAGLIQIAGQTSVVLVYAMEAMKSPDGSFTRALLVSIGLMLISVVIFAILRDKKQSA